MKNNTGIKNLAEAIILQSVEDLWHEDHRDECLSFFQGEGFTVCANAAGMPLDDRMQLLKLVKSSAARMQRKTPKPVERDNATSLVQAGRANIPSN